ncbi:cell cycle checkpoint protein RAD17 [Lissotriton helveticus]
MSKTSYSRKLVSAKITDWVEPSFEDLFGNSVLTSAPPGSNPSEGIKRHHKSKDKPSLHTSFQSKSLHRKRAKPFSIERICDQSKQPAGESCNDPWIDKYKPESQAELAVHKKKIEEVERWLKGHIAEKKQGGSVLLLTGPPGCGKTATMSVLTKDLGIQVQEWTNPFTTEYKKDEYNEVYERGSNFQPFTSQSQTSLFQEFLLRANKYNKLQMLGQATGTDKRLILVEDMPNQFYRDPPILHEVLRRFVRTGRCPVVFIISDSLSGDRNQRLLFPKDVQEELFISNISFNPVAPTSMLKVLNRIGTTEASLNNGRVFIPDKTFLELLCTGSSGDIRSAINSLQFSSSKDGSSQENIFSRKRVKHSSKAVVASSVPKQQNKTEKVKGKQDDLQAIGGKDVSLFLFRALGKILHFKRGPPADSDFTRLPSHLSTHERDPLLVQPEGVVEKSHMPGDFFNLYLHQNYLDFFTEIDDIVRASEYLSIADFFSGDWNSRSTLNEYSASVATRGVIHSNKARTSALGQGGVGFKPLHKPQWLLINKKYRENCLAAKSLFSSFCMSPSCLQTQLLPYLAMLTNPMRNQAQIAFIQDVGRLPLKRYFGRLKLEALTDMDSGVPDLDSEDEEELSGTPSEKALEHTKNQSHEEESSPPTGQVGGSDLPSSQPQPPAARAVMEEDEVQIEEYDSD